MTHYIIIKGHEVKRFEHLPCFLFHKVMQCQYTSHLLQVKLPISLQFLKAYKTKLFPHQFLSVLFLKKKSSFTLILSVIVNKDSVDSIDPIGWTGGASRTKSNSSGNKLYYLYLKLKKIILNFFKKKWIFTLSLTFFVPSLIL